MLCPEVPIDTITSEEAARQFLGDKEVGFLQFFNTHRTAGGQQGGNSSALRDLVLGRRLGGIAAQMLGVKCVRVYQVCE